MNFPEKNKQNHDRWQGNRINGTRRPLTSKREHAYKLKVQADDSEKLLVQTYGPEEYLRGNYLQQRTVEEYLLLQKTAFRCKLKYIGTY